MAWGKEWPKVEINIPAISPERAKDVAAIKQAEMNEWFKTQPDMMAVKEEKVYNNKVPTHDPYTNPDAQIYYECGCGKILDPCTKSFAALNNYASAQGWKVRWRKDGMGYEPFCVECGKDVPE